MRWFTRQSATQGCKVKDRTHFALSHATKFEMNARPKCLDPISTEYSSCMEDSIFDAYSLIFWYFANKHFYCLLWPHLSWCKLCAKLVLAEGCEPHGSKWPRRELRICSQIKPFMGFKDWWIILKGHIEWMSLIRDAQVPTAQGGRLLLSSKTKQNRDIWRYCKTFRWEWRDLYTTYQNCVFFILGP